MKSFRQVLRPGAYHPVRRRFPPSTLPLLVAGAFLTLSGCQQPTGAPSTPILSKKQTIVQFTSGDLQTAIATATAAEGPNNPEAAMEVTCFSFLNSQLAVLQPPAGGSAPSGDVGLATGFVDATLVLNNLGSATSPAMKAAYAQACGPLIIYVQNQGLTLGNQVAALGALIAR